MSLNKALVISFVILILLVVVTAVYFSKQNQVKYVFADSEVLMTNIHHVPEILRSYEKVKGVYDKKNTLIFRYAPTSCSSCLDNQLYELLLLQEEIGRDHIWIYPAYPDDRNSRIRLINELAKYNYRNIPADSLLVPICHGEQKSYFAWLNNEGEIDFIFIPERDNVYYTRKYFHYIKRIIQMTVENWNH